MRNLDLVTFGLNALWLELCANPYLPVGSSLMPLRAFWPFLIPMREFPWSPTTHFWEGPLTSKVLVSLGVSMARKPGRPTHFWALPIAWEYADRQDTPPLVDTPGKVKWGRFYGHLLGFASAGH